MKDLSKKPIIFEDQCWRSLYCPIVDLIKSLKKGGDYNAYRKHICEYSPDDYGVCDAKVFKETYERA